MVIAEFRGRKFTPAPPLKVGDCVVIPFMVRQAHHERKRPINESIT
jgi:hypothetical protein